MIRHGARAAVDTWRKKPLLRDVAKFGTLFAGAEFSQQTMLKKVWKMDPNEDYNWGEIARYAVFGFGFYPFLYSKWYGMLDRVFPGTAASTIAKKVFLDQFTLEPVLICVFYVGMNVMEGRKDVFQELKDKFVPTFSVGCLFWIPAMAFNFRVLSPSQRVTFVGAATFTWCNFLCWLKRRDMSGQASRDMTNAPF